jgi:peptidoglycan/LPS O-acetylase OafA/YrhL
MIAKPAAARQDPQDLKALTSLRFFAALMIAMLHLMEDFDAPWRFLSPDSLRQGVTFFFVLSGFILTHVYLDKPGLTARRFMTLRLARLYPSHIAALVLLLALLPWKLIVYQSPSPDVTGPAFIAKILLLDSFVPTAPVQYAANGVSWSISTELFFYLAFPFLIVGLREDWLKKLALAALVCAAVYLGAAALGLPIPATRADVATISQLGYSNPLARGFEFTLGMATYVLWERHLRDRAATPLIWTLLEFAALGLALGWTFYGAEALAWRLPPLGHLWLDASGSCFAFAILIAVFARARGAIGRALSWRFFVWLGEISFSFYIVHQIVLRAFAYYWGAAAPIVVAFAACLIVAAANHHAIETPARRLILILFARRPRAALARAAS